MSLLYSLPPSVLQGIDAHCRDSKEKGTQKYDLEELMTQFNFIVQSHSMPGKLETLIFI